MTAKEFIQELRRLFDLDDLEGMLELAARHRREVEDLMTPEESARIFGGVLEYARIAYEGQKRAQRKSD